MDSTVRYHPLFHRDVIEAAGWYDERSSGLGDSFVFNAESATSLAIKNSYRYPKIDGDLRVSFVKRFPYVVVYKVIENDIHLLGVVHTARSIKKWRQERQ